MPTQITFTDDVGRISTASNADGTIRWHVYERPFGAGTSIYIQREVNGVQEAEVRLLNEGQRPEVFFDTDSSQWLLFYVLNENAFLITADENDTPVTQPPQTGTTLDQFRPGASAPRSAQTLAEQNNNEFSVGLSLGIYDGPPTINNVDVGQSSNPGAELVVRWSPPSFQNLNVVGFVVFRRDFTGGLVNVTPGGREPFQGFDFLYEVVVPAASGTYYVAQINTRGDATDAEVIGDIVPPGSQILGDGTNNNDFIDRLEVRGGDGRGPQDLNFAIIGAAPVTVIQTDTGRFAAGEGFLSGLVNIDADFEPIIGAIENDAGRLAVGEGFFAALDISGFGGVIVG